MDAALELLRSLMQRGGPVMWPIALCSLLTLFITLRKTLQWLFYLLELRLGARAWREALADLADPQARKKLAPRLKGVNTPTIKLLRRALEASTLPFAEALQAEALREVRRLGRGLGVLDTIVTLAPMLGILGTVTGIIASFNLMGQSGVDDPTGIAAGIAEALITTAAGLVVSIAALLPLNLGRACHNALTLRLQEVMTAAEHAERAQ
ncbi:MAG: MotA/TolQ/ExbB proton channel family protein [Candidatus Spyradenecus sp.]